MQTRQLSPPQKIKIKKEILKPAYCRGSIFVLKEEVNLH